MIKEKINKAGIGFSDREDSFEAGKESAKKALKNIESANNRLVLAFVAGKHNYKECLKGIKSVVGDASVLGGPALGLITNKNIGYKGYEVGVAVLPEDMKFESAFVGELDKSEKEAGIKLGKLFKDKRNPEEKLALLFYDSIKSSPPPAPVLNVSSLLLKGFEIGFGKNLPPVIGSGLIGTFNFDRGELFTGEKTVSQAASAVIMSGNFEVYSKIMHGCEPMSDYHTITGIEGPVVYEIDGQPAMDVIDNLLGNQEWQKKLPLLLVTLGVNFGEKFAPYNEDNYVNRLIVGIVPEKKGIVLFEADFSKGTEFQFMRRNEELMAKSAEKGCQEAISYHEKNKLDPVFALYIDCAGRSAGFSGAKEEEAAIIQKIIGKNIPLLGFYSGVEIAPLLGESRGLDWTGVLMILSRKK